MTARQINLALRCAAATLLAAAAACVAIGLWMPLESARRAESVAAPSQALALSGGALPPLEAFSAIWARPLRQPLVSAQAKAEPAVDSATAAAIAGRLPGQPLIALMGTIGTSVALLRGPDGEVVAKGVGDQIAGAEVVSIRPAHVEMRFSGRPMLLDKPPDAGIRPTIRGDADGPPAQQ